MDDSLGVSSILHVCTEDEAFILDFFFLILFYYRFPTRSAACHVFVSLDLDDFWHRRKKGEALIRPLGPPTSDTINRPTKMVRRERIHVFFHPLFFPSSTSFLFI